MSAPVVPEPVHVRGVVTVENPAQYELVHAMAFRASATDLLLYQATLQVPLMGWSFAETTGGASASVDVYDGLDATGVLLATITLASGESTRDWLGPWGLMLRTGLFLDVLTGSVKGAMWMGKPR